MRAIGGCVGLIEIINQSLDPSHGCNFLDEIPASGNHLVQPFLTLLAPAATRLLDVGASDGNRAGHNGPRLPPLALQSSLIANYLS